MGKVVPVKIMNYLRTSLITGIGKKLFYNLPISNNSGQELSEPI